MLLVRQFPILENYRIMSPMECPASTAHALIRAILLAFCFLLAADRLPFADLMSTAAFADRLHPMRQRYRQPLTIFIINPSITNEFILHTNVRK